MEKLNLNHFYYFYITAKEGSIIQASKRLHVTAPTISDQIRLLEEFFECKLFQKVGRSLVLTDKGRIALEYAEDIFSASTELTHILKYGTKFLRNNLEIGITDYMSQYFLYELIIPLLKSSETTINFKEDKRQYLIADLEKGEKDIVFTYSKDSIPPSLMSYRVGINKTYVVAHKKFKDAKKDFPKSLTNIPFMNYTKESFLRYEIDQFFAKYGLAPKPIGECDEIDLLELTASEGVGFVIVPEIAKKRFCQNTDVTVLGELKEFQTTVWALMRKDNTSFVKKFIEDIAI